MAVSLRLIRTGAPHKPYYRLVAQHKRSRMGGEPLETLGAYDVRAHKATLEKERIEHWLKIGALPSNTVRNILLREGIIKP